ncbi:macro domain-containing protein [bacterium SCSIO 12741]|nr:macro domain-containing protein [bacterium SCSIO 12741]
MNPITYTQGDATQPKGEGPKFIVHVCNDIGGWGRGFVMALSARWKEPEQAYRNWARSKDKFRLGEIQSIQVEPNLWVINMIAQRDVKPSPDGIPPIREVYVGRCLAQVRELALEKGASIHMPRIGCGLAGGKWENIQPHI